MENDKIEISIENLKIIKDRVKEIENLSRNEQVIRKAQNLTEFINKVTTKAVDEIPLEELVYNKMVEVKFSDKELNARLYILHKNLINNKISKEKARQMYEDYERESKFEML